MTFNALRNAGAKPPDTVAVLGMGGLGRPLIETYPLDRASEAYDRMMRGKARFRVVLQMS
jgi:D-arabinose 1-dehydrogenase-like Zn-dependent alcohol dehydrogenase